MSMEDAASGTPGRLRRSWLTGDRFRAVCERGVIVIFHPPLLGAIKGTAVTTRSAVPDAAIPRSPVTSILLATLSGYVLANLLCLAVASITFTAGASEQFRPLTPTTFGVHVILGSIAGSVVWSAALRLAR